MSEREEKLSQTDICLNRVKTDVECHENDIWDAGNGIYLVPALIEHRAWVCPFCEQSREYLLVNGKTVLGGQTTIQKNGKTSQACERPACKRAQEEWHKEETP